MEDSTESLELSDRQTCQDTHLNIARKRIDDLSLQILNVSVISNLFNAKRLFVDVVRGEASYSHWKVIFFCLAIVEMDWSSHGFWGGKVQRRQWRQGLRLVACPDRSQNCGGPL